MIIYSHSFGLFSKLLARLFWELLGAARNWSLHLRAVRHSVNYALNTTVMMGMSLMQFALPHFATDVSFCTSPELIAIFVRAACAAHADIFSTFAAWLLPPALRLFPLVWLVPGARYQPISSPRL